MWVTALLGLVKPILARVLAALGLGIISYGASTGVVEIVLSQIASNLNATPAAVLQIVSLYGLPNFIGILLGAYSTSMSLQVFKKIGFL